MNRTDSAFGGLLPRGANEAGNPLIGGWGL